MYHFVLNSNGNQAKVGLGYRTNDLKSESMVSEVVSYNSNCSSCTLWCWGMIANLYSLVLKIGIS